MLCTCVSGGGNNGISRISAATGGLDKQSYTMILVVIISALVGVISTIIVTVVCLKRSVQYSNWENRYCQFCTDVFFYAVYYNVHVLLTLSIPYQFSIHTSFVRMLYDCVLLCCVLHVCAYILMWTAGLNALLQPTTSR